MTALLTPCPDCGSDHLGGRCHLSFGERIRTVELSPGATPTRRLRRYFDAASLPWDPTDARERMMEETRGRGPVKLAPDGAPMTLSELGTPPVEMDWTAHAPEVDGD